MVILFNPFFDIELFLLNIYKEAINNYYLVNAHTVGSKFRHWSYQDSPLWSPNIKYTFLHVNDEIK